MKLELERKITKVGNGSYVLIPKSILEAIGKSNGDIIKIEIKK